MSVLNLTLQNSIIFIIIVVIISWFILKITEFKCNKLEFEHMSEESTTVDLITKNTDLQSKYSVPIGLRDINTRSKFIDFAIKNLGTNSIPKSVYYKNNTSEEKKLPGGHAFMSFFKPNINNKIILSW